MSHDEIADLFAALSDKSRLQLLKVLLEKPQYVEELAKRFNLSMSTVSFHLAKLEKAGLVTKEKQQYYTVYFAKCDLLNQTIIDLIKIIDDDKPKQLERIDSYRQKIIKTFMPENVILKIP